MPSAFVHRAGSPKTGQRCQNRRAHRVYILTIAILVLFEGISKSVPSPAVARPWPHGSGVSTYEKGEGLLVLGDLLFSQCVRLDVEKRAIN